MTVASDVLKTNPIVQVNAGRPAGFLHADPE